MPMNPNDYPPDWPLIRARILDRAGDRCECEGECGRVHVGRCGRRYGDRLEKPGRFVVLTTAHLWRGACSAHHAAGVKCGELEHLKAMCQACHLAYDLPHHVANAKATRLRRRRGRAAGDLFGVDGV